MASLLTRATAIALLTLSFRNSAMTTESAIAKAQLVDEQAEGKQETTAYFGRPIASNDIDNPDDLMGYLD